MRTITIGFSRPKEFKILAKLIMWFEGTNFSHAYVKFNAPNIERDLIYQASGKLVNFEGNIHFQTHAIPVHEYQLDVEDDVYKSIMQFCVDNAGIPYGIKAAIGAGLVKLVKLFGKKIENPFSDGVRSEFCSEITDRILTIARKLQMNYDNSDSITPKDLKLIMDQIPEARKIL